MKNNENNYIDIAKYIKEQENRLQEVIEFHANIELIKKESSSIIQGTIDYLWRNGFGESEIDILVKDMIKKLNDTLKQEKRVWGKWIN